MSIYITKNKKGTRIRATGKDAMDVYLALGGKKPDKNEVIDNKKKENKNE